MQNDEESFLLIVDRTAVIVEPTEAFLGWLHSIPGESAEGTLQDIQQDCTVYLLSPDEDRDAWLRKNYKVIFNQELWSWCTTESLWPKDRSYDNFKKFLTVRFHSMVIDCGPGPICAVPDPEDYEEEIEAGEAPRKPKKSATKPKALTLKVTLNESDPPIWRRLQVLSTMTLGDLHYAIQIAMGWENCHLHEFEVKKAFYGVPDPGYDDYGQTVLDEDEFTLDDVLKRKGSRLLYRYDFGDDWEHTVVVEDTAPPDPNAKYPCCTDGAMACPPEDSGWLAGYYRILEILKDPKNKEYDNYKHWMPPEFDPQAFDPQAVNAELKRIKKWRKRAERE